MSSWVEFWKPEYVMTSAGNLLSQQIRHFVRIGAGAGGTLIERIHQGTYYTDRTWTWSTGDILDLVPPGRLCCRYNPVRYTAQDTLL